MASSSQPGPASQKTAAELTPAQLKRRLAVEAAMAKFAAMNDADATKTAGVTGPSATATPAAPAPPVPPTPEEAAKAAEQQAIDDKVAKLSPSQRSLFKAGLYMLPAEKKAKVKNSPPPDEGSTAALTSDVKPVVPNITPVSQSQSWLSGGDTEGDAIEIDSSDDDGPATPAAVPLSLTAVDPSGRATDILLEVGSQADKAVVDTRMTKQIAARRRASAKRARGGFDTNSSEEEDVKPRCVQRLHSRSLSSKIVVNSRSDCIRLCSEVSRLGRSMKLPLVPRTRQARASGLRFLSRRRASQSRSYPKARSSSSAPNRRRSGSSSSATACHFFLPVRLEPVSRFSCASSSSRFATSTQTPEPSL